MSLLMLRSSFPPFPLLRVFLKISFNLMALFKVCPQPSYHFVLDIEKSNIPTILCEIQFTVIHMYHG